MNKKIVLYDGLKNEDFVDVITNSSLKTKIDIRDSETGKIIFKGLKNKVIISGSGLIARYLFDVDVEEVTPTYDSKLSITIPEGEETHELDWGTNATLENPKILLFCIGRDGCGTEDSQVYPVDYTKWIAPDSLVPFRYQLASNDLSDDLRETYFGRVETGDYIAYYFKRFDGKTEFNQKYIDGTPIDQTVFDSPKKDSAETYVEMVLKVTKEDVRDYFNATVGIDSAKINTISLCYASPVEVNGKLYFKNIRPITKLNIPNEPLIDVTKGIDIIYQVYM